MVRSDVTEFVDALLGGAEVSSSAGRHVGIIVGVVTSTAGV